MDSSSIRLIDWRWEEVKIFFAIVTFIFVCGMAKIAFYRAKIVSSNLPESCVLILLGVVFGLLVFSVDECQTSFTNDIEANINISCKGNSGNQLPQFSPTLFFFILLPPLILEASYSLHNKIFFNNIDTIIIFACIGTLLSFLLLGILLVLTNAFGLLSTAHQLTPVQIFLFSSFISSVDPVAVLSIFSDLGINSRIYFLVFGESLLNDGVSVALYNIFHMLTRKEANGQNITFASFLLGLGYFLFIVFGGLLIGCLFGILSSLLTKQTQRMKEVEPLVMFSFAYLSYICAELFGWSGILALISCGLFQSRYAFRNISSESLSLVKYSVKLMSSSSECILFLYLGMEIFQSFELNLSFLCWSLLFCFFIRFIVIFGLSVLINKYQCSEENISFQEQFIMSYAGLRGAMSFSLVLMIDQDLFPETRMFKSATLIIILFTVFVQGGTIKYWVRLFDIKQKKEERVTILESTNDAVLEHVVNGIEGIATTDSKKTCLRNFDKRYLKYYLIKTQESENGNEKLSDHFINLFGPTVIATHAYEQRYWHDTPDKISISARRKFKRALSMNVGKTSFANFSKGFLPEEDTKTTSRHESAFQIKRTIRNAFENDFLDVYQPTHLPQLVRSFSMETQQQVGFSKIPVHARSGLAVVMEKHNEMKRRRTGTPGRSGLEDKDVNLFFAK